MIHKVFLQFAAISGMLAVVFGAFGSHALKEKLSNNGYLDILQTAVSYQFYHTLALFGIGILAMKFPSHWLIYAGYGMMVGILFFSGSLILMCFTKIRRLGGLTPIGGLGFITGWVFLFVAIFKTVV